VTIAGVTVLTNSKGFTLYFSAASIPAGRVGEPGDIARAYLYCLTQPFATGLILTVDGGTALA
jgi:NAD(P)-dependent dehydrogenase (short-subunit alcohol dehydrogenase family)